MSVLVLRSQGQLTQRWQHIEYATKQTWAGDSLAKHNSSVTLADLKRHSEWDSHLDLPSSFISPCFRCTLSSVQSQDDERQMDVSCWRSSPNETAMSTWGILENFIIATEYLTYLVAMVVAAVTGLLGTVEEEFTAPVHVRTSTCDRGLDTAHPVLRAEGAWSRHSYSHQVENAEANACYSRPASQSTQLDLTGELLTSLGIIRQQWQPGGG